MSFLSRLTNFLNREINNFDTSNRDRSLDFEEVIDAASKETQKILNTASRKTKTFSENVEAQASERVGEIKKTIFNTADSIKFHSNEFSIKAREYAKDNATGKYLTVNILSKEDDILARRGEMITYSLLQKAEKAGKLDQVLKNTSKSPLTNPHINSSQAKPAPRKRIKKETSKSE